MVRCESPLGLTKDEKHLALVGVTREGVEMDGSFVLLHEPHLTHRAKLLL